MEKRIFEPLGMKHSYYGSAERVIPRRVPGYSGGKDGFVNAAYLSMTQPYAAGSLLSTVDDLARWDAALYAGTLVRPALLERAFAPFMLADGRSTRYGYGWTTGSYEGHRAIEHGGGINGFSAYALRMPQDRVFVGVLLNRDTGNPDPEGLALKAAALAIGKPYSDPVAISLPPEALDAYVGVYQTAVEERVRYARPCSTATWASTSWPPASRSRSRRSGAG